MLIRFLTPGLAAALLALPPGAANAQGLVIEQASPLITPALAATERPPASTVRCYQHGSRVLDDELPPETVLAADPPAGALQLRRPDGQRLVVLAIGEGLCVLKLKAPGTVPAPNGASAAREAATTSTSRALID